MTSYNQGPYRSIDKKLEKIRMELTDSGQWPEPANRLWFHLAQDGPEEPEQGDDIMLSVVVSDAMDGVDIADRYPEFYRSMLQNPELFQEFLDTINLLEADKAGILDDVPAAAVIVPEKRPMDAEPEVVLNGPRAWIARWMKGVDQLSSIFLDFGPVLQPGYRKGWGMLDEHSMSLISSHLTVDKTELGVRLTAALSDDPDSMDLQLMVALLDDEESDAVRSFSLMASVQWGNYHQTSAIDEDGRAYFPPLPISAITDRSGEKINTNLQLMLHPRE
jgi:hypothetical protein